MIRIPKFRKEVAKNLWELKKAREDAEKNPCKDWLCHNLDNRLYGYLFACYDFEIIDYETLTHITELLHYAYLGRRSYKEFKEGYKWEDVIS